jgi:hypothetical protein
VVTFATPGPLGFYVGEPTNGPPTLGMVSYAVPERYARFAAEGVTLAVAGFHGSADWHLVSPRTKHRSRMHWHVAERTIHDPKSGFYRPGAVPVVLNVMGIGDTAIGAILVVAGDVVYFPPNREVLDGITARVVKELCGRIGIPVHDSSQIDLRNLAQPLKPGDERTVAGHATEIVLVGTGFGVAGVREFALSAGVSRKYPVPGSVLTRLRAAFAEEVGRQYSAGI